MGKLILILGGARSGKSRFAVNLAKKDGGKVSFIATCLPKDLEMKTRIRIHKKARPSHWQTFEEPEDLPLLLKRIGAKSKVIIIDCLTLWVSNLLLKGFSENNIEDKINEMLRSLSKTKAKCIVVSNEVGLGIVPKNKLARNFRDIAGRINQLVAVKSDEVFLVFAGIPVRIKGELTHIKVSP